MAAVFVFLTASTTKAEAAIVGGGFFLSGSLGEVVGLSVQSAILQATLKWTLERKLIGVEGGVEVGRWLYRCCVKNLWVECLILDCIDHSKGDCKCRQYLAFAHGSAGYCGRSLRPRFGIFLWYVYLHVGRRSYPDRFGG
jgi:hypothetical protein